MHDDERGFTLAETVVAIALTVAVVLATVSAVTHALHVAALETTKMELRDDALDALADLRAATAYDPVLLANMIGKSSNATLALHADVRSELMTLRVEPAAVRRPGGVAAIATATVARDDARVEEQATLYAEAPAPGSTVDQ